MKEKILALLFPLLLMNIFKNRCSTTRYIWIQYLTDPDKPFPQIIFYLNDSDFLGVIDPVLESYPISKVKVSENEFESVNKTIGKDGAILEKSTLKSPVGSTIVKNGEKKFLKVGSEGRIREIFDTIIIIFHGTNNEVAVNGTLQTLMRRMGLEVVGQIENRVLFRI